MACCKCEEHKWDDPQPVVYTDSEDGKEYCLFHAPVEHKGVDVDEFNAQVFKRIQATIDRGDKNTFCHFDGAIFSGDISFANRALPKMSFEQARFLGRVFFENVRCDVALFGQTNFVGRANFASSIFKFADFGEALFEISEFRWATFKALDFKRTHFRGRANFREAKLGSADFCNAIFDGIASFHAATFSGRAVFFSEAIFKGKVDFRSATFVEGHFWKTTFMQETDFSAAKFDSGLNFVLVKTTPNTVVKFSNCSTSLDVFFSKLRPHLPRSHSAIRPRPLSIHKFPLG